MVTKTCEVACVKKMGKSDRVSFSRAIEDDYRVHWLTDNLPVGMFIPDGHQFVRGFPVGSIEYQSSKRNNGKKYYLNNHARITIEYNDNEEEANGLYVLILMCILYYMYVLVYICIWVYVCSV